MTAPDLSTTNNWTASEFPHFTVFAHAQLGRRMTSPSEHWTNARIIAKIPLDEITSVTVEDLRELGVEGI